jgi:hypothetical protein
MNSIVEMRGEWIFQKALLLQMSNRNEDGSPNVLDYGDFGETEHQHLRKIILYSARYV